VQNAVRMQSKLSIELKSCIRKKDALCIRTALNTLYFSIVNQFVSITPWIIFLIIQTYSASNFRYSWHFNYLVILYISKTWNKKYLHSLKITKGRSGSLKKNITSRVSNRNLKNNAPYTLFLNTKCTEVYVNND